MSAGVSDEKSVKHDEINDRDDEIFKQPDQIEHYLGNRQSPFITKKEHKALMGNYNTHMRKVTEEAPGQSNLHTITSHGKVTDGV